MEKEKLVELIDLNYSQREIGEKLGYSQGNIKYWLKIFNLKTKIKQYNKDRNELLTEKFCSKCKKLKPINEFYIMSDRKNGSRYCKICDNEYSTERMRIVKIRMIEYKGGCCKNCGLKLIDSHYSVFDFHHTDPNTKDPNFRRIKSQKWEKIKAEIDKCELLCSNCHRIKHTIQGKIV